MLQLKTRSVRGASNHSAFMGKWSTVISLIHPKDELSFKEVRMWDQCKISSCCIWIGVNQEKWEAGGAKITNNNGGKLLRRRPSCYKKVLDRVVI